MLPKMKAETIAPVMMIKELASVWAAVLGESSLPTMVRIE